MTAVNGKMGGGGHQSCIRGLLLSVTPGGACRDKARSGLSRGGKTTEVE